MDAAAKVLQEAMNLPGVKTVGGGNAMHSSNSMVNISVSDRASIFTLLVNLLTKLKNLDEATQTIKHAIAKAAMADIYMKHRKDKKAFARCYKAIVDHQPTVQSYLILGDALLAIQE